MGHVACCRVCVLVTLNRIFLYSSGVILCRERKWDGRFSFLFFFFNDPPPTEISPLPLPAVLPISAPPLGFFFPAALGLAYLPADPDAGARLRDPFRRARARIRGHRHRGGRRALRTPGRHVRGLARHPVPPPGLSVRTPALKEGPHRTPQLKLDTGKTRKIPESSNRTRTTVRKLVSSSRP